MQNLANSQENITHPFFRPGCVNDKLCLCLITSDGGLCGSYNDNIIEVAEKFIIDSGAERVSLICVGKKGFNYFKRNDIKILNSYVGLNGRYLDKVSTEVTNELVDTFVSNRACQIYVAYTHFQSALIHKPRIEKFLNIERNITSRVEYILEPDLKGILGEILPNYISMKFKLMLMEAFTAEHSARTLAMKSATDNAKELLESLVLLRNKVRQANITQEIMEIISSSEALKG
jgi:F-type H+-transporting ATPase subunit gamma